MICLQNHFLPLQAAVSLWIMTFSRSSRGHQWWNSLTRTDDDNSLREERISLQSKSIKQKLVWFLLRTLRSVFSPDWWTQIALMDWFHVENGCKNQSVGSVFSSLCLSLTFFRKSESFKFRKAPELHASSRSSLASSLASCVSEFTCHCMDWKTTRVLWRL